MNNIITKSIIYSLILAITLINSPILKAENLILEPLAITEATYLNPDTPSNGIYHVMVNGKWELFDSNLTGVLSGSVLKN